MKHQGRKLHAKGHQPQVFKVALLIEGVGISSRVGTPEIENAPNEQAVMHPGRDGKKEYLRQGCHGH